MAARSADVTDGFLAELADTLLPGGDGWPSASEAGIVALLTLRIVAEGGDGMPEQLAAAIERSGGPLGPQDEAGWVCIVAALESAEPKLFGLVRDAAYMSYYESAAVAEAINAKGYPYQRLSHVTGYPEPRFHHGRDTPRHHRGSFQSTDAVQAVDLSGLDLGTERTRGWGLKR